MSRPKLLALQLLVALAAVLVWQLFTTVPIGGVSHWVAYGIPVSVTGFAEGEVSKQTEKYVGGKSLMGLPHYFGPCTPPGAPHHYTFTLIATDLEPNALQPGLTRDELIKALDGHAKGATGIIGTFSKP